MYFVIEINSFCKDTRILKL